MPKVMDCPFFKWEEGMKLHCEAGVLDFGDKSSRQAYTDKYCANLQGYCQCSLADCLNQKYEREDKK